MTRWPDLEADPHLVAALENADLQIPRAEAVASKAREPKHKWSNAFADECARMVASEVSRHSQFSKSDVRPNQDTNAEPVTFLAGGKQKKIDVVVSSVGVGLQVGISLKGMNFRDRSGLQFDKNLTGRTYELEDEVRVVHRTLPMSFMVGLFFVPIASTVDKQAGSTSSFARTVEHLRRRLGRTDPLSHTQTDRLDMGAVAIYVPGDSEEFEYGKGSVKRTFSYSDTLPRGVIRFFNVKDDPPKRGRPKLEMTLDLRGFVDSIAYEYRQFSDGEEIEWSEPEND